MVNDITTKTKHKDGLLKWTSPVLDGDGRILSEYLRSVTLFLNLFAIDGTAAGVAERPIVRPKAKYPDGVDHLPIDPATNAPAVGLNAAVVQKLLETRFVDYSAIVSNVNEQDRIIFQVIYHQSISKQSQALVKNCVEWGRLDQTQCAWDELLNLLIRVHTVKRGGNIAESAIHMKIELENKIRNYKQGSGVGTGVHIERYDDLLQEAKTIGLSIPQPELAFLFINSTFDSASRTKRKALITLGQPTPACYEFAKAFVLEAEAVQATLKDIDGTRRRGENVVAVTSATPSRSTGYHSKKERYEYARLPQEQKNVVNYLEDLTRKVRGGDAKDIDLKTITSTVSSLSAATKEGRVCYICGKTGHRMKECATDPAVCGYPFAPPGFRPRTKRPYKKGADNKSEGTAAVQTQGVEVAAVQDTKHNEEYDSDGDELFLGTVLVTDCVTRNAPKRQRLALGAEDFYFGDSDQEDAEGQETEAEGHVACVIGSCAEPTSEGRSMILKLMETKLGGLHEAMRLPSEEEVMLQADLMGMPSLSYQVLEKLGKKTTTLRSGVQVIKGGPFDTNCSAEPPIKFNQKTTTGKTARAAEAQARPGHERSPISEDRNEASAPRDIDEESEETLNLVEESERLTEGVCELEQRVASLDEFVDSLADVRDQLQDMKQMIHALERKAKRAVNRAIIRDLEEAEKGFDMDLKNFNKLKEENEYLNRVMREERKSYDDGRAERERLREALVEFEAVKIELENAKSLNAMLKRGQALDRKLISNLRKELETQREEYDARLEAMRPGCVGEERDQESASECDKNESAETMMSCAKEGRRKAKHAESRARMANEGGVLGCDGESSGERSAEDEPPRGRKDVGEKTGKRSTRSAMTTQERELAKLASSGIDVDDFRERRAKRYDAEEEEADLREIQQLRRQVVWDCERSRIVRERIRKAHVDDPDSKAEAEFKRLQFAKDNGGITGYLSYLNAQLYEPQHNCESALTIEQVDVEVSRLRLDALREKTAAAASNRAVKIAHKKSSNKNEERVDQANTALVTDSQESDNASIHDKMIVCLDNAATLHVFRDKELLHSLESQRNGGTLIGGLNKSEKGVRCKERGMFLSVSGVHYGPDSIANLLSFAKLRDQGHRVKYDDIRDLFKVQLKGCKITLEFKRAVSSDGMHYIRRMERNEFLPDIALIQTVKEQQEKFLKKDVVKAARAREQMIVFNYMSPAAHKDLLENGYLTNNSVTGEDLERSLEIWGRPTERMRGNSKYKKPTAASIALDGMDKIGDIRYNMAHVDLFFVKGICFIVIVLDPMKYCWVKHLANRATETIQKAVECFLGDMASHKVRVSLFRSDGEGGVWALETWIKEKGILMDKVAAGAHCEVAERKIEQGKEGVRRCCSGLPYHPCRLLIIASVLYTFKAINLQRTSGQIKRNEAPPQIQLTGVKLDAKMHFPLPFGTYVEVTVRNPDNSNNPRSEAAIYCGSLYQATENNSVYLIKTRAMAERGNMTALPMSQSMIDVLNRQASRDFGDNASDLYFGNDVREIAESENDTPNPDPESTETENLFEASSDKTMENRRVTRSMTEAVGGIDEYDVESAAEQTRLQKYMPISTPASTREEKMPFDSLDFWARHGKAVSPNYFREWQEARTRLQDDLTSEHSGEAQESMEISDTPTQREDTESNDSRSEWSRHDNAMVMSPKEAIKRLGEKLALPAISQEIKQMLDKVVWEPMHWEELTTEQRKSMISSSMFLKEKFYADGNFEKLKARLVAGGHMQNREMYNDISSPTVRMSSLFAIIAVAAHEGREVQSADIPGAYLNAEMKEEVLMWLDGVTSAEVCKLDPSYTRYINEKGKLAVKLNKALYGCVESAKLWYDNISKALINAGFVVNPHDICVFNRGTGAEQLTVAIYVDDLLATCKNKKSIEDLWRTMKARYVKPGQPDIVVHIGPVINYLGMTLDFRISEEVAVTQSGYIKEMASKSGIESTKNTSTPASDNLFVVREDSEAGELTKPQKEWFHSFVAKCLYLSKRSRPDILTVVSFLTTRVTKCNMDDMKKLLRLLYYLQGTADRGIVLRIGRLGIQVRQFIDAAYGVFSDMKSSSGGVIMIGDKGPVDACSCKQTIVTKSSMEAELVAASDLLNEALYLQKFLESQGHERRPVILYQDNQS